VEGSSCRRSLQRSALLCAGRVLLAQEFYSSLRSDFRIFETTYPKVPWNPQALGKVEDGSLGSSIHR